MVRKKEFFNFMVDKNKKNLNETFCYSSWQRLTND